MKPIEPKQYFENDAMTHTEEFVAQKSLSNPADINDRDIEILASNFLVNEIYYNKVTSAQTPEDKSSAREQCLKAGAAAILENGQQIKEQLNENDASPEQPNTNGKADVAKISGGTMSRIIQYVKNMLGASADASKIDNFGAIFKVLSAPELSQKFAEVTQILGQNPVLVADIRDTLEGTKGGEIFNQALANYLEPEQQRAILAVESKTIEESRKENLTTYQPEPIMAR